MLKKYRSSSFGHSYLKATLSSAYVLTCVLRCSLEHLLATLSLTPSSLSAKQMRFAACLTGVSSTLSVLETTMEVSSTSATYKTVQQPASWEIFDRSKSQ
jgi:hypothetical protein